MLHLKWGQMLSIISISLTHYCKPPQYSEERAFGSGFQCLSTYSVSPTLTGCVGLYGLYVHVESFTHFQYIHTASAENTYRCIQQWQWQQCLLKKKCICLCTCKAELHNKLCFYAYVLPHRGCCPSDAMSSETAALRPCSAPVCPMHSKLAAVLIC